MLNLKLLHAHYLKVNTYKTFNLPTLTLLWLGLGLAYTFAALKKIFLLHYQLGVDTYFTAYALTFIIKKK